MKDFGMQLVDHTDDGELMDLKVNLQHNADGLITQGLLLGNTLEQNKALILIAHPNDFKANPTLGVGIGDITLDSDLLDYRIKIREDFATDGLQVDSLDLYSTQKIKIEASYE